MQEPEPMEKPEFHAPADAVVRFISLYDSGPWAKALSGALQEAGLAKAACLTERPVPFSATDGLLLLAYTTPYDWLASAIAEGRSASEALNDWMIEAKLMLNLYRVNRHSAQLVNAAAALADPKKLTELLAGKLPVNWQPNLPKEPNAALVALSKALLATSSQAQTLAKEQEAATVNPAPDPREPTVSGFDVLAESYRTALEVRSQLEGEVRRASARAADLQTSYSHARRSEVKLQSENREISQKLEVLRREHTRMIHHQNELELRLSAFDSLEARARLAEERVTRMREKLDTRWTQRDQQIAILESQIAEQQMALQSEIAERERILQSHSIRMTAPLRRFRALFGRP